MLYLGLIVVFTDKLLSRIKALLVWALRNPMANFVLPLCSLARLAIMLTCSWLMRPSSKTQRQECLSFISARRSNGSIWLDCSYSKNSSDTASWLYCFDVNDFFLACFVCLSPLSLRIFMSTSLQDSRLRIPKTRILILQSLSSCPSSVSVTISSFSTLPTIPMGCVKSKPSMMLSWFSKMVTVCLPVKSIIFIVP